MFIVGGSLDVALWVYAGIGLVALPFALRGRAVEPRWQTLLLAGGGLAFGVALWQVAPQLGGDALFHLARARKLAAFDGLSLDAVNEFVDGGLHPGYAFPLWHGFLALIANVAGVDPALVLRHEASILAPVAVLVAYEAGYALFRSRAAGAAVVSAQVGLIALAPGAGGAYNALALPATASRQLLVPAALALFFAYVHDRTWRLLPALAAAALAIALVHPTYAVFLCVPLGGYVLARGLMARGEIVPGAIGLAALVLPTAAVVRPRCCRSSSRRPRTSPTASRSSGRSCSTRASSTSSRRRATGWRPRSSAAAARSPWRRSCCVPLAALAPLRRWSAFVLGGSLAVLAVTLTSALFPAFADLVSISQARRAAGFLPFAFAFAGGMLVLASLLAARAAAGRARSRHRAPGRLPRRLRLPPAGRRAGCASPGWPSSAARRRSRSPPSCAGRASASAGLGSPRWRRRSSCCRSRVDSARDWEARPRDRSHELSPGLVQALRDATRKGDVVFSDTETSYRIAAYLPLYVASAPPAHVADTEDNQPYDRRRDAGLFLKSGDLEIPRRYGADWIVVNKSRFRTEVARPPVYEDERYVLYRV